MKNLFFLSAKVLMLNSVSTRNIFKIHNDTRSTIYFSKNNVRIGAKFFCIVLFVKWQMAQENKNSEEGE